MSLFSQEAAALANQVSYVVPGMEVKIKTDQDLQAFLESETFRDLWNFLLKMNSSSKDVMVEQCPLSKCSAVVHRLVDSMKKLENWIEQIPPVDQPTRFGNKAFRDWIGKLECEGKDLIANDILQGRDVEKADQLAAYLATSFGNKTRIDYGTGHEASFLVFLFCLTKIGAVSEEDSTGLVLQVLPAYLRTTRKLQKIYVLEPAGSHGVWGLDDFSFLPFLLGSSQLYSNQMIPTNAIYNKTVVGSKKSSYLYFDAIASIHEFKTGSLTDHSPMICDIAAVREGWPKINQGMLKMYRAEVWGKRQVVQHLVFGTLFPFPQASE